MRHSWANSNTLSSGKAGLPRWMLLRLFHSDQMTAANSSGSLFPAKINSNTSIKEEHAISVPWIHFALVIHFGLVLHKSFNSGQWNKACTASSGCSLHRSQVPVLMILRWTKFILAGRESLQALHARCFTLFGTSSNQIFFPQWLQSFSLRWARLSTKMLIMQKLVSRFNWVRSIRVERPNQNIILYSPTE